MTPKQKLFCREYLVDLNATQAAMRAGYSKKSAKSIGQENLTKPDIQKRIQESMDKRVQRVERDADTVLNGAFDIAEFDLGELFDENGHLLNIPDMPEHVRRMVGPIEIQTRFERGSDEDEGEVVITSKIKVFDRLKAYELAGKHTKIKAFDNTLTLELPPRVIRNFTGRKKVGLDK